MPFATFVYNIYKWIIGLIIIELTRRLKFQLNVANQVLS